TTNDAWKVGITVDHQNNTYAVDDEVVITVTSAQAGYLYVFNVDGDGNIVCLFPNKYQTKNDIPAGTPVVIPDPNNKTFRFRADKVGKELIKAIVTKDQAQSMDMKDLTARGVSPVTRRSFIRLATEAMGGDPDKVPQEPPAGQEPKKPEVVIQKEKIQ